MQKVVLLSEGAQVRAFWALNFTEAQNAVISHMTKGSGHRATITDETSGDLRVYSWANGNMNINKY